MFGCFQDYAAYLKPDLDSAFSNQLRQVLGSLAPTYGESGCGLTGGKKIRGALLCLVNAALGGHSEAALPRAVAVELIQTATLIHDDFVDQHRTRRCLPALWLLESPRKAVLLGDVIFSTAIFMMSELGREDCGIVSKAIAQLACGACQEPLDSATLLLQLEEGRGQVVDYQQIIRLKTGILFAAACELGALAAGADKAGRLRWQRYGMKIGEAYQVADDLHEIHEVLDKKELAVAALIELVPALLFFVPQSHSFICRALRERTTIFSGELWRHIRQAANLMKEDRQRRLRAATAELDNSPHDGPLMLLMRRTPLDLVQIFDSAAERIVTRK